MECECESVLEANLHRLSDCDHKLGQLPISSQLYPVLYQVICNMASSSTESLWLRPATLGHGYGFGDTKSLFIVQLVPVLQSSTKTTFISEPCRSGPVDDRLDLYNSPSRYDY